MAHGAPDNYQVSPKSIVYTLQDDAELAVRLRAISSIDRLGNVFLQDDLSNGFDAWDWIFVGAASTASLSTTVWKSAGFAIKATAGIADEDNIDIARSVQFSPLGKIGYELSFSHNTEGKYIISEIHLYDKDNLWYAKIRYDSANYTLAYYKAPDDWVDFDTNIRLYEAAKCFHTIKFVVDFQTKKYISCKVNQNTYDLSGISLYSTPSGILQHFVFGMEVQKIGAGTGIVYFDDIIVTQNEP